MTLLNVSLYSLCDRAHLIWTKFRHPRHTRSEAVTLLWKQYHGIDDGGCRDNLDHSPYPSERPGICRCRYA